MANIKEIIAELKSEAINTRRMLDRIPTEKLDWRMHDKSMKLGRLATHIAEIPAWITKIFESDSFDFANSPFSSNSRHSTQEILEAFDQNLQEAIKNLETSDDASLNNIWTVCRGEQIFYQLPKKIGLRNFAFNHLYHHRGQLSVYLRLLEIPVPGMYGPSADEIR